MSNPFHVQFFNQLHITNHTGTCPRCGTTGLEVRSSQPRGGERFVLHCGTIQNHLTGQRLAVALQLVMDARQQKALEESSERAREALLDQETDYTWAALEQRL